MKKTLIALAALATTAAFAQSTVTLSGKYGFAYAQNESFAGAKTKGFETTDGDVVFAAVEDLGGGMKAAASLAVRVRGRDANSDGAADGVGGRDATVSLMGGFGRLVGGSVEAGNGIIGRASAGAPTIGLDNGFGVDAAANVDWLAYYTPALMGGLVGTVQLVDSIGDPGAGGSESTGLKGTVLGVTYDAGPLSVGADYTKFGGAATTDDRFRISASYNLGVARVGAGYQTKSLVAGGDANKQLMLGVSAPFGPVTVGAVYSRHTAGAYAAALGVAAGTKVTGLELGASYAFSKRTDLQVAYQSLDANTIGNDQTAFRVRLMHRF